MSHCPWRSRQPSNLYRDIAIDVYILAPAHLSSNAYNFGGGVSLLTKSTNDVLPTLVILRLKHTGTSWI